MAELYLYVVQFNDHVIKVGRSSKVVQRIKQHRREARKIGASIQKIWISFPYMSVADEAKLIAFCKDRWPLIQGFEYFLTTDFDAVVDYATELDEASLSRHEASQ
jgi:hypothetical protein